MQYVIRLTGRSGDGCDDINSYDGSGPTRLKAAISLLLELSDLWIINDPEFWADLGRIVSGEDLAENPDFSGDGWKLTCECEQ